MSKQLPLWLLLWELDAEAEAITISYSSPDLVSTQRTLVVPVRRDGAEAGATGAFDSGKKSASVLLSRVWID